MTPFDVFKRITESQPNGGAGNPIYSLWFRQQKQEFLRHHPETYVLDGNIVRLSDIVKLHNWIVEKFVKTEK